MSRTAGGERVLGDTEKEAKRRLMWRLARFAGVEIQTYAVMDNHYSTMSSTIWTEGLALFLSRLMRT